MNVRWDNIEIEYGRIVATEGRATLKHVERWAVWFCPQQVTLIGGNVRQVKSVHISPAYCKAEMVSNIEQSLQALGIKYKHITLKNTGGDTEISDLIDLRAAGYEVQDILYQHEARP